MAQGIREPHTDPSDQSDPTDPHPISDRIRDRFWIFSCAANSDFPNLGRRSVMTPVEGAFYLGVPNMIVVQSNENEAPYGRFDPPIAQYAQAMRPLKRLVWSVVGSGGIHSSEETEEVLQLARTAPNFHGIMLDDFFNDRKDGREARYTVDELGAIRRRLLEINKDFSIFVTLYTRQCDLPIHEYLELMDVITFWTWEPDDLVNLESNFAKLEQLAPEKRKILGCYLVDFRCKSGVPVPMMKLQCETGLRWLREGRIEGMVFLGNTVMDLGFDSVEWTRDWIREVGDENAGNR
jgi:hypothetical protein